MFLFIFEELGENPEKSFGDEEFPSEGEDGVAFWNLEFESTPRFVIIIDMLGWPIITVWFIESYFFERLLFEFIVFIFKVFGFCVCISGDRQRNKKSGWVSFNRDSLPAVGSAISSSLSHCWDEFIYRFKTFKGYYKWGYS